jgi:hypothetical protein
MSENLDLVRSIFAPWERGDFSRAEWANPEIGYVVVDGPAPGAWTGRAGMVEGVRDWLSAWEDVRQEAEEYRELDSERVLVLHRFSARGKKSGLALGQIQTKGATLFEIRRGEVTTLVLYFHRDCALADLGLED